MTLRFYAPILLLFALAGCQTSASLTVGGEIDATGENSKTSSFTLLSTPVPHEIANYTLDGNAIDIALSQGGDIAYIAQGTYGLDMIDVTDPYHPHLIASYDLGHYVNRVSVVDDIAYAAYLPQAASDHYTISLFDVGNPYAPHYMGTIQGNLRQPHTSIVEQGVLYTTTSDGIALYDLSVGIDDQGLLATYEAGDHVYALAKRGHYLFLANGRWGLTVLKID